MITSLVKEGLSFEVTSMVKARLNCSQFPSGSWYPIEEAKISLAHACADRFDENNNTLPRIIKRLRIVCFILKVRE